MIIAAAVAGVFCFKCYSRASRLLDRGHDGGQLARSLQRWAETRYVLTDRFMYAFRAGMPSSPRLSTGIGKGEPADPERDRAVLAELREFHPEQIVIGRRKYGPEVMKFIAIAYRQVDEGSVSEHSEHKYAHYVRNDLPERR